ncbi:MAG: molybdenum cofactor biosynthesis protein MoaE [Anaeromyxobacter sp.]
MPTLLKVVQEPIRPAEVEAALEGPGFGAQAVFRGVVRDHNDGRRVRAVSYDVHAPLAEATFREIAGEALARWGPALALVVIHRVGRLEVGEASVVVGAASPHRDEAFQAARHLIEQLKLRAPIWKQEHYVDGDSEWLQGHCLRHAR